MRKEIFAAAILAGIILTGAKSQSVQAEVLSTDSNNVTEVETSKVANNKQLTQANVSMSKENQTHDSSSMVSGEKIFDVNKVQENKIETASNNNQIQIVSDTQRSDQEPSYLTATQQSNYLDEWNHYNSIPDDKSNLQAQLTSGHVDLQLKQMTFKVDASTNNTRSILVGTKSTKQQAKKILSDEKKDLDTAKRNLDKTNKTLANVQIRITVNQEVAKNTQKELDSLNNDLAARQTDYDKTDKALNDAKVNYQVKKTLLASTKENKSKLKKELANAEEKQTNAKKVFKTSKKKLTSLKEKVAQAKEDLDKVQTKLIKD
ncbi:hypothetical protein [Ligilactobacillus salivarius]|uniref:hypothetical protein n=1 Tax=Ligilactobacillus salivarius TaxID=1624 RepID=UPI0006811AB2|nr:hypothetical protein [Ligilactobacillus salivarius]